MHRASFPRVPAVERDTPEPLSSRPELFFWAHNVGPRGNAQSLRSSGSRQMHTLLLGGVVCHARVGGVIRHHDKHEKSVTSRLSPGRICSAHTCFQTKIFQVSTALSRSQKTRTGSLTSPSKYVSVLHVPGVTRGHRRMGAVKRPAEHSSP